MTHKFGSYGFLYSELTFNQKSDLRTPMNDLLNLHEPARLSAILAETKALGFDMPSEPLTGALLRALAASKPSGHFLELGSGTGIATAWILDGMDAGSRLTSLDNNAILTECVKRHLGADSRLTLVCADGDVFLPTLSGQRFDFIFADTWPGKYHLLDETLALLKPGGLFVIDDMLPQANWPAGHPENVVRLIAKLEELPHFKVVKLSWASGIIIATKTA